MRNPFAPCLLALLLTWATQAVIVRGATPPAKPNLLFILTDDQASWGVGAYGNPDVVTPNMDRLARNGVLLRNAYAATPVCSASRATFLTGLYGTQVGITDFLAGSEEEAGFGLPPERVTWPEILQQQGYQTSLIGKWHLGTKPQFHPTRHGFDQFFGFLGWGTTPMDPMLEENGVMKRFKGAVADILTERALHYLDEHRAQPFALFLHYREPHMKYVPQPEEDMAVFRDRDVTVPDRPGLNPEKVKQFTREYYTAIHAVDRNLGRLLAKLDQLGLAQNTIVVFTSDHGYMIGQHGLYTKGNAWWLLEGMPHNTKRPNLFEESLRIPFIVRWPGVVPAGTETKEPFSTVDVYATMLGLMGIPIPAAVEQEGEDYSPRLRGKTIPWRDAMFAQYDLHSGGLDYMRMIRTDRWKLVRHYLSLERDELYDLENDPHEEYNLYRPHLAKEHIAPGVDVPKVRAELQDRLYGWQRAIHDPLLLQLAMERDPAKR